MFAIGFIITVFVLKVLLDVIVALRRRGRPVDAADEQAAGGDEASADDYRLRRTSREHTVETGVLATEESSGSAAGARSMFDEPIGEPVGDDGFRGSRYDD